eukprot:3142222-Prymnesium_polylepis.1
MGSRGVTWGHVAHRGLQRVEGVLDARPIHVRTVREADEQREHEQRHDPLPDLHDVGRDVLQDDDEPQVGGDREEGGDAEDALVLNKAALASRDRDDADGGDHLRDRGRR